MRLELNLEFMEAINGTERKISLNKPDTCPKCHGSGLAPGGKMKDCPRCKGRGFFRVQSLFGVADQPCPDCGGQGKVPENLCPDCRGEGRVKTKKEITIRIPAGVSDGDRLRVRGGGEAGYRGAPAGDLFVNIFVKPHELFKREGANIFCDVPVSFPQAALGCEVEVPTVNGQVTLKVPPGTQSGKLFRIKGKGARERNGAVGDHYVTILVETPKNLTKEQKDLLVKFAESCGEKSHPVSEDFLTKVKRFLGKQ